RMPRTVPVALTGSGDLSGVKVVRFGASDPAYPRNRVIARALRSLAVEVDDVVDTRRFPLRTPALVARALRRRADLVYVGFPAHIDVMTARLIAARTGARVLFDPLIGLHETNIGDRRLAGTASLQARRYALEDRLSCVLSD